MVVLGVLLIAAGLLAVAAALLSSSGTATFLGADLAAATIFFLGVGAGLAVLWGYSITKLGARRSCRLRRENRQLREQNARNAAARPGRRRPRARCESPWSGTRLRPRDRRSGRASAAPAPRP